MPFVEKNAALSGTSPRSGRYQMRFWHYDINGARIASSHRPRDRKDSFPDLINTAYRNADGSRTVYGLAFDFDAHRADPRWLDVNGHLDWARMSAHLAEDHPLIFHEIAHVVRSTGGKGLGLVLAINPLPIQASTEKNQRVLLNLQSRLITFFDGLGFGADPGARGLQRDLPNFQDPGRSLFENRLALRRAELSDEGVATKLHAYLNALAAAERHETRIYNDARAETGLARLVAWILGAYDPMCAGVWVPSFLSGETVYVSAKTLLAITGLSAPFLRAFLQDPPAWLRATYLGREEGWRLHIPLGRAVQRLLPRAEALLATADNEAGKGKPQPRKLLFSVAAISEPDLVRCGEHNAWVTSLALAYKWHGYSREEALAKILLRTNALPERATSTTCRSGEIPSIVRSIYKNVPMMLGRFAGRDLPEWMTNDDLFAFGKKTSLRGGVAPVYTNRLCRVESQSAATPPKLAFDIASGKDSSEKPSSWLEAAPRLVLGGSPCAAEPADTLPSAQKTPASLVAVRWRQRVGIFNGETLVVCFTKRHYRAAAALGLLSRRPEYADLALRLYTPHLAAQERYRPAIDAAAHVLVSGTVFGAKKTCAEKFAAWAAECGVENGAATELPGEAPF